MVPFAISVLPSSLLLKVLKLACLLGLLDFGLTGGHGRQMALHQQGGRRGPRRETAAFRSAGILALC